MKKHGKNVVPEEKIPSGAEEPVEATASGAEVAVPVSDNEGRDNPPATLEERLEKLEALLLAKEETPVNQDYFSRLRQEQDMKQAKSREALVARLKQQEQEAQEIYPKLSLKEEAKDPRFVDLLKCGLDVRSAFEVIHKDEIIAASMEYAAREVERMMTNKILAGALRPAENGGKHGPAVTKTDVKSMTRQERRDMIRRVAMGEKITL